MKLYTVHKKQKLPISLNKAWSFLSDPNNLSLLTPKEMNFTIISKDQKPMYAGQVIQYSVTPIAGIKTKWISEITHLKKDNYFIDVQLFGPYSFWHHKHFIKEIEGGVIMEDVIHYKPPFGLIGVLLNFLFINSKLNSVFKHRKLELIKTFGNFK